jgi:NADH dehydrogenase
VQIDTVASSQIPGFVELGISPHSIEAILRKMLPDFGRKRLLDPLNG